MTTTVLLLGHVILALVLIVLILLQHGKGADAGAAFGSGASSTVFGSQGSGSFMSRATKWLAVLFFITSGSLAWLASERQAPVTTSVMDEPAAVEDSAPPADSDLPPLEAPVEEQGQAEEPAAQDETVPEDDAQEDDAPPPSGDGN